MDKEPRAVLSLGMVTKHLSKGEPEIWKKVLQDHGIDTDKPYKMIFNSETGSFEFFQRNG
jgi:hypothetical protein